MRKEYKYKLQGDGRDSWTVTEFNELDEVISVYMVYEDPTQEIGTALKAVLNATPNELEQIKTLLGIV
jgi:nitrate reductase NapAB chaperone NapD